jgi:hypothetical protein
MYVVLRGFTFDGGLVCYGPFPSEEKAERFVTKEKERDYISIFKTIEVIPK